MSDFVGKQDLQVAKQIPCTHSVLTLSLQLHINFIDYIKISIAI